MLQIPPSLRPLVEVDEIGGEAERAAVMPDHVAPTNNGTGVCMGTNGVPRKKVLPDRCTQTRAVVCSRSAAVRSMTTSLPAAKGHGRESAKPPSEMRKIPL